MSETILKKRLLGKEDIQFDLDGSGGVQYYTDANGVQYAVHKLNAGHMPLTSATREAVGGGVETVEDALKVFKLQMPDEKLTADRTITFTSDMSNTAMQAELNKQPKNLNSHNLIVEFPAGMNFYFSSSLLFDLFYNGQVYLQGNGNKFTGGTGNPFMSFHCDAHVTLNEFDIHYSLCEYAVSSNTCKLVFTKCSFTGNESGTNYAVYCELGHVKFQDCIFSSDKHVKYTGMIKDDINALDKKIEDLNPKWSAFTEQVQSQLDSFPNPAEYITAVKNGGVSLETSTDNANFIAAEPIYYANGAVLSNGTGATSSGSAILSQERHIYHGGVQEIRARIQKAGLNAYYSTPEMGTTAAGTAYYKINFPAMALANYEVHVAYEGTYDNLKRLDGLHYSTYNRTATSFCIAGLKAGNNETVFDNLIMDITIRGKMAEE